MGDFTFSRSKFSKLRQAQDAVREAGLRLALTISPFVSVDSPNFRQGVMEGLFVMERELADHLLALEIVGTALQTPGGLW